VSGPVSRPERLVSALSPRRGDEGPTDAELIERIASGELGALGALYDRYHDDVRRFAARATSGGGDVDDVVHDTFLTLARASARYDGRPNARPFLLGVAAQLLRRRRRSLARLSRALRDFAFSPGPQHATPEQEAGHSQERARFEAALAKMSDEKRLVFVLFEREGLSGDEIARALEIPVNTVWTRLHHARAALRKALGEGGRP
jgi:RNA polymerase sigma factor (sigma-70 family)